MYFNWQSYLLSFKFFSNNIFWWRYFVFTCAKSAHFVSPRSCFQYVLRWLCLCSAQPWNNLIILTSNSQVRYLKTAVWKHDTKEIDEHFSKQNATLGYQWRLKHLWHRKEMVTRQKPTVTIQWNKLIISSDSRIRPVKVVSQGCQAMWPTLH